MATTERGVEQVGVPIGRDRGPGYGDLDDMRPEQPLRREWVARRRPDAVRTQIHYARRGDLTPEMWVVAEREGLEPACIRDEVAR
ncbi:MAG: hypothetical protein ACT4PE_08690, partial [Candidatus Eiseniibacteriota bacterium]